MKDLPGDIRRWKFEIEWIGEIKDGQTVHTQTWSGNVRMLRCAEKLGFVECNRNVGTRKVGGQKFDGLTFRLKREEIDVLTL